MTLEESIFDPLLRDRQVRKWFWPPVSLLNVGTCRNRVPVPSSHSPARASAINLPISLLPFTKLAYHLVMKEHAKNWMTVHGVAVQNSRAPSGLHAMERHQLLCKDTFCLHCSRLLAK
jgi:hypothetical protein